MDQRTVLPASAVLPGTRAVVWLSALVALLSLGTGVVNISATTVQGPLSAYVPTAVQRTAGFTGALTGFVMLLVAAGMRRRLRVAWVAMLVLLPVTGLQGVVQSSGFSLPLVVLSLLAFPAVLVNSQRFDRAVDLTATQLAGAAALVGTQAYGTVGAYTLRDEFIGVSTLTDAVYYTIVTASTVGYGDVTPISATARLFGMSVVLLGVASFTVALGSLLGPAIQARLSKALGTMTDASIELLEDHVLVLGYGDLTEPLVEELSDAVEFVVVTPDSDVAVQLRSRDVHVVIGDPSHEVPLEEAGIEFARAVIAATEDDAADAFSVMTARELRPDIRIVAAARTRRNSDGPAPTPSSVPPSSADTCSSNPPWGAAIWRAWRTTSSNRATARAGTGWPTVPRTPLAPVRDPALSASEDPEASRDRSIDRVEAHVSMSAWPASSMAAWPASSMAAWPASSMAAWPASPRSVR
jgi:voltage-gated potassium channel